MRLTFSNIHSVTESRQQLHVKHLQSLSQSVMRVRKRLKNRAHVGKKLHNTNAIPHRLFVYYVSVPMFVCILLRTAQCLLSCLEKSRGQFFSLSLLNWKQSDNRFSLHIPINIIYHQEGKRNEVSVQCEINKRTDITWAAHTGASIGRLTSSWEEMLVPGQLTHMSIYYVCFASADLLLRFEATSCEKIQSIQFKADADTSWQTVAYLHIWR